MKQDFLYLQMNYGDGRAAHVNSLKVNYSNVPPNNMTIMWHKFK